MQKSNEIKAIPLRTLRVDEYQRGRISRQVNDIDRNFDEKLVGVLYVSFRNGIYYIVDGQQRWNVLLKRGYKEWNCLVHYGLTFEEESAMFGLLGTSPVKLSATDIWKSRVLSKEQKAVKVDEIIKEEGYVVSYAGEKGHKRIRAIRAIEIIYDKFGEDILRKVLRLITSAWNGQKLAVKEVCLIGLAIFFKSFKDDYDSKMLEQKLKLCPIEKIIQTSQNVRDCGKRYTVFAEAVVEEYNKCKKQGRLESAKLIG